MYACPRCGEAGITKIRKFLLVVVANPFSTATCSECERDVGLHVGKSFAAAGALPASIVVFGVLHAKGHVPSGAFLPCGALG